MIDDEESATLARWVLPAGRRRATYPHPNTVARPGIAAGPPRRYGDGVLALGTAQNRPTAQPPPVPPPRALARASTSPSPSRSPEPSPSPEPAAGDRAAWRWLAMLTAIVAALVVGAVAYAIVGLGLVAP
jgi:hypothetical protein